MPRIKLSLTAQSISLFVYKISVLKTAKDFFYYQSHIKLSPGCRVWVPFRKQKKVGIILETIEGTTFDFEVKAIDSVIDCVPIVPETILSLCKWISAYYQAPLSEVLLLALPKKLREGKENTLPLEYSYTLSTDRLLAHSQVIPQARKKHALIDFLADALSPLTQKELSERGYTSKVLAPLLELGIVKTITHPKKMVVPSACLTMPLCLNEEQRIAVDAIIKRMNHYHCFLLYGITGSGKTEVYLQVISEVMKQNKQVLILVPEIGLTPQLLQRFSARIAAPLAVVHSNLNDTERMHAWQLAGANEAKIIIGTRSAVFTPMPQLGLIVIDEEHDHSLKQMEGVRYSAKDSALMRAYRENIPIILGSATPSLESLANCPSKYELLRLNNKAMTEKALHFQLVDLRNQNLSEGFAQPTLHAIRKHLENNNQVLVFINRRGYAPVILCHQCGWIADCKKCDSHLTWHNTIKKLLCHHCGLVQNQFTACKNCKSTELLPIGVGTQRVQEFLQSYFPSTQILRIDRDEVNKKNAMQEHLEKINSGEAQLIIGTQMLAKGHHFPRLSLVVIVNADNGFYNQDFRAIENFGQLLVQVSGRAGRAEVAGHVIIQTHVPDQPALNILLQKGYDAFAGQLLAERKLSELPPFTYLAMIRAQGRDQQQVLHFLHQVKKIIANEKLEVWGPAPAPLAKKANYYRLQLMVKAAERKKLHWVLIQLREKVQNEGVAKGICWSIDVDPIDIS